MLFEGWSRCLKRQTRSKNIAIFGLSKAFNKAPPQRLLNKFNGCSLKEQGNGEYTRKVLWYGIDILLFSFLCTVEMEAIATSLL